MSTQSLLAQTRVTIRRLADPVTLLTLIGLAGFFEFYGRRTLVFVATALALGGVWAVLQRRWDIAIPIQTFFLGTWAYNYFEGRAHSLLWIMVTFAVLLAYAFWKLFRHPALQSISTLQWLYISLATLILWEQAIIIKLFWPVEPWSRTFIIVATLIFLEMAVSHRLSGSTSLKPLAVPLVVICLLTAVVILSTPIPLG